MNDGVRFELDELSIPERIKAISEDVKSGKDKYRNIEGLELAELVGIDDVHQLGDDWLHIHWVYQEPLAEYIWRCGPDSQIFDCLEGIVKDERFATIRKIGKKFDETGKIDLDRLRKKEIRLMEETIAEKQFQDGWSQTIVRRSIKGPRRHWLQFEGYLEDDNSVGLDLLTPYDERDGNFLDLKRCVWE